MKLTLTPLGMCREFAAGVLLALPVCLIGMVVVFLPDYLGSYQHKSAEDQIVIWWYAGLLLALMVLGYGVRRATRVAFWEIDGGQGCVRMQLRTLFGGVGQLYEATREEIQELSLRERGLVIKVLDAPDQLIARAWFWRGELETIERCVKETISRRR